MAELEQFLIDQGAVSRADIDKALTNQSPGGERLSTILDRMGILQGSDLAILLAKLHGLTVVRSEEWPDEPACAGEISAAFLRNNRVYPLARTEQGIDLAMFDPGDAFAIQAVRLAANCNVRPYVATREDLDAAIGRIVQEGPSDNRTDAPTHRDTDDRADDIAELRDLALGTPVVRIVSQLLEDAAYTRATDIHIERFETRVVVRMRIDGLLREVSAPPVDLARGIVSRIKILAGLNIAERRLPQDGRARVRVASRMLDLRVATMPTIYGETVAIRLLDNIRRTLDLSKLGFSPENIADTLSHLAAPYGLIVVTGPTGSGKTTTLASALTHLNAVERKILTIEDPIEYELDGVNQTQVKPDIGLTFASSLRSFLRHDPDVLMVGEMRDPETAQVGVHAALTGHLVLTSLHTNTAAGAVSRLLDMGVDAYLLASSLRCVIGQRLVRLLCTHCRERDSEGLKQASQAVLAAGTSLPDATPIWKATGCARCGHTGYMDRVAITEVLSVDEEIRALIRPGVATQEIEAVARARGMQTMLSDGLSKCAAGLTTIQEIQRVAAEI